MSSTASVIAATRFGLGASPGDLDAIDAIGPKAWLQGQILSPDPATAVRLAALPPSNAGIARMSAMREADKSDRKGMKALAHDAFVEEQCAHLEAIARSTTPFHERLVAFWANHFTVSTVRNEVELVALAFEREVIRPHLGGNFEALLLESTRHPAMLAYLDNHKSIGPNSPSGEKNDRGLNENLAREVLELHALGVDGGYTQADVTAFACILTGWGVDPDAGGYVFNGKRHEPGHHRLLGKVYWSGGEVDGVQALRDLARHPSTARHIARQLVRHFVADDPPPDAVEAIRQAFVDSGGHLPTVHLALVELAPAWSQPLTKLKAPWDLVLSTARALHDVDQGHAMLKSLVWLGQTPNEAPSPQGWPDVAAAWLGPEAVLSRLDWAAEVGRRRSTVDAAALARDVLGPLASQRTLETLQRASGPDALALLLASPEFQRR